MKMNEQSIYRQELNFAINAKTNNEEAFHFTDQRTEPHTSKCSSINESISSDSVSSKQNITLINNTKNNLKYLTKYKNIYVPKIFLINYNDISIYPPKDNTTNLNRISFPFFNFQNIYRNNPYLNYGYNYNQWKEYANSIKNKFDELNDLTLKGKIKLPEPDNELQYLMALPSDFGGLGNIYHDDKFENVKFYDSRLPENANKHFMSQVKIERNMTWFPLKPNPESFTKNKNINPFQNLLVINNPINTNYTNEIKDKEIKENNINDIKNNENDINISKSDENIKQKENRIKDKSDRDRAIQKEKEDKSESREKNKNRSRSRSRNRNKKRSISNNRNYYEKRREKYDNRYRNNCNYYRNKEEHYNYYNGYSNNYNKRYSRYKRYNHYKDYY